MSKILVTGGLGYIGSHTVVELLKNNYEVVIIDNLSNSELFVLEGIKQISNKEPLFYQADVLDREALKEIFSKHEIDTVIHFAAFKAVGESVEEPLKYYMNNVGGLLSLLAEMENYKVQKMVFSSSCTVYGQPDKLPVDEKAPIQRAESPYGDTKIQGEKIIESIPNLSTVALRYFNPIGAHDSGLIGELPIGVPNNLVPFITQSAAGLRGPLEVYGNDYNTKDGTCVRDYIHVMDLAIAHVKAIELVGKPDVQFEAINIGTGNGFSVLELITEFNTISDLPVHFKIGERRAGDIEKVWARSEKSKKMLGWEAERDLKNMLETSWNWQKKVLAKMS